MRYVEVTTQAELDALKPDEIAVVRDGRFEAWGSSHVEARGSSHVVARGSSHVVARGSSHVEAWDSSHVEAWGSSHVVARGSSHVEARGSSHVEARGSSHVEAWESSHVEAWESSHVEARDSSHVEARDSSHVVARGSSHVVARESSHVEASKFVATHRLSTSADVRGGVIIDVKIETAEDWCDFYGIPVTDGKLVLFKAVNDAGHGGGGYRQVAYRLGETSFAPDWDPTPKCGGGLHLSPHPRMARSYNFAATRYLACQVDISTLVMVGDKAKVPSCAVLHEVTLDGEPIPEAVPA